MSRSLIVLLAGLCISNSVIPSACVCPGFRYTEEICFESDHSQREWAERDLWRAETMYQEQRWVLSGIDLFLHCFIFLSARETNCFNLFQNCQSLPSKGYASSSVWPHTGTGQRFRRSTSVVQCTLNVPWLLLKMEHLSTCSPPVTLRHAENSLPSSPCWPTVIPTSWWPTCCPACSTVVPSARVVSRGTADSSPASSSFFNRVCTHTCVWHCLCCVVVRALALLLSSACHGPASWPPACFLHLRRGKEPSGRNWSVKHCLMAITVRVWRMQTTFYSHERHSVVEVLAV